MTLEQLNKLAEDYGMIVVVLALIIAIIVALRKAWPAISQFVHFVDVIVAVPVTFKTIANSFALIDTRLATVEPKLASIEPKLASMEAKLHLIEHEMKPNSGKSMKDQANRNEKEMGQIKEVLGLDPQGYPG